MYQQEIFSKKCGTNLTQVKKSFTPKATAEMRHNDITVRHHNTASYDNRSLITLGLKFIKKLPTNVKPLTLIKRCWNI